MDSIRKILFVLLAALLLGSCSTDRVNVQYDFNNVPDRIWVGEDFWTVPLEDWQVKGGRVECRSGIQSATLSVLTRVLKKENEPFSVSVKMGLLDKGTNPGSAGLTIGSKALEEDDVRSAIYFGTGINCGVNTEGYAFIGPVTRQLPEGFDLASFTLDVEGSEGDEAYELSLSITDASGKSTEISFSPENPVEGIIQVVNNMRGSKSKLQGPEFWYDDLSLSGSKFELLPANHFGPVLWTMYTVGNGTLKLSAQMAPVEVEGNHTATLQFKRNNSWNDVAKADMDADSRIALFRVENHDGTDSTEFRVLFPYTDVFGQQKEYEYAGTISAEPAGKPLRLGALTCQYHYGFPYSPLVKNLKLSRPDLLYFSGDQIYEQNGGYPIKREPEDVAILNYLGKWYMFGWAFRDVMRNLPVICTPDDHDVFQGNIWGEAGLKMRDGVGDFISGYRQTPKMVNVVHRTNCAHLPDPFDPSPMDQGISVWYTSLTYGGVSFAIVSDRIFKSGPENVAQWEGRRDHVRAPLKNPASIERADLQLLGKRQEDFLNKWILDWKGALMKVLLSQTLLANVATHHGQWDYYLYGDMDSGGWPKTGRDKAIELIRKAFVFHVAGDQHVASMVQYGLNEYRDAGWAYINPAIAVGYSRWFRPDELGVPVKNRPEHGFPNTGEYKDAFGNLNYVYAIGNPANFKQVKNRYELANVKGSGYGMVIFDTGQRTITSEAWKFLADVANPKTEDQYPGWPFTVKQTDNYGRKPVAWLPEIKINGNADPVIEVTGAANELIYILRIQGNSFRPWVFKEGSYTVKAGYPETGKWKEIQAATNSPEKELSISF